MHDFRITNTWGIFPSSACVSSTLTALHHLRLYASNQSPVQSVSPLRLDVLIDRIRRQPLRSNHVEFLTSKPHFIFGYKRFISYLGRHPKTLRSDEGTEIFNKEQTAYLDQGRRSIEVGGQYFVKDFQSYASCCVLKGRTRQRRTPMLFSATPSCVAPGLKMNKNLAPLPMYLK